ncbi:MAG: FtsH protease activity modulator HflK [Alphaproteobacteria bacterium]|nr:FtsH protease activity modulator HflK [Alphaproteobacteria bacterium]
MLKNDQDNNDDPAMDNPWLSGAGDQPKKTNATSKKSRDSASKKGSGDDNVTHIFDKRPTQNSGHNSGNPIDDLLDKMQEFLKTGAFPKGSGGGSGGGSGRPDISPVLLVIIVAVVSLGAWLSSGFYRVQEGEVAVVLRFGEMVRISPPGLQYRLPAPIEVEMVKKVTILNKIDSGYKSETQKATSGEAAEQNLILTGDENMVHTNYTVLWKIKDVAEFLFTARDPEATIRVAAESSIRETLGQTTATLALTKGRELIGTNAQALLQKILDTYKMGVQIVSVQLQRVEPPVQVVQAFNDMQASLVDADRLRNEAEAYRNDILPRARGEAEKIAQESEAYRQQVIAQAEGEAARFNAILVSYRLNPEVTIRRYYLDTMQQVLKGAQKTIVDGKTSSGIVPYLNLQQGKISAAVKKGAE